MTMTVVRSTRPRLPEELSSDETSEVLGRFWEEAETALRNPPATKQDERHPDDKAPKRVTYSYD